MLDLSSVVSRYVSSTVHREVVTLYDVCSSEVVILHAFLKVIKRTLVFVGRGALGNRVQPRYLGTGILSISRSEPYMLDACLGNKSKEK